MEKKQIFIPYFRQFLIDIGLDGNNISVYGFGRPSDEDGEPVLSNDENVKKYIDVYNYFENENTFMVLVFGLNRIILIITTKKDRQEEIMHNLEKFCKFIKPNQQPF